MYFIEAQAWAMQTTATLRGEYEDAVKVATADEKENKANIGKEFVREIGIDEKVSEHPSAAGSIYAFNDIYIELRAGALQDKRGFLTLFTLPALYLVLTLLEMSTIFSTVWWTHVYPWSSRPADAGDYIAALALPLITLALILVLRRFAWRWLRLENFVQRRLLIRFNRITRQVYLHRPRYAGGIAILAWEQVSAEAGVGKPEVAGTGTQLLLAWTQDMTGLPHSHLMFVGKTADGTSDLVNLWEFIRRYMEEGPDSVPRPRRLLTKLPWPWLSLAAPWSFLKPLWRAGQRRLVVWLSVLLSPVMLIHAAGHWISLLLCWEPRWPRIIRQAGLPGKPCPPLSVAADWPPVPPPTSAPHPHTGRP
ncbi:DUF6708 domain-containing protein [Achromobacter mucicolens]|uniref:DUF6708 domain-containing protein n=1 Tax=Achromobacter mucicolens TaxID=1389922 RepID=UPI0022F3DD3C|nr:DUF6708 domain-containing protein [Achromobacter mucicolens]WBX87280.1 hypothetical protein PE062_17790 [Achromobacter mucicolens]